MSDIENALQFVTFQLGSEKYGINIMDVKEIVGIRAIRNIPNVPQYVAGLLNLRGMIFPVIDLHRRFQIDKAKLSDDDKLLSGFIIIEVNSMKIGIIIDKVLRVVNINIDAIKPPPQIITGIGTEYISGVIQFEEDYLIILNIGKLFDPNELRQLTRIGQ
jgi:purine-binding chemotaxis protein CheW